MTEFLPQGSAINDLLRECFRLNRSLVTAAQSLTEGTGITGAQWGVLTAFSRDGGQGTVAEVARRMGLARQSVQRVADLLAELGLIEYLANPNDKRAKLVNVTGPGKQLLSLLNQRQQAWLRTIVSSNKESDIDQAAQLVKELTRKMMRESDSENLQQAIG